MQELVIIRQNEEKKIAFVEDGILKEYYIEQENNKRLEGNIYVGKVKDILPGMQAAFVDIGEGKNTFIHIQDILPKISNITGNKNESLEKYSIKDFIKENSNLLVQVKKDSISTKGARITTHIHIPGRFIVILPENNFITVSQKIEDEEERKRLIDIVEKIKKEEYENIGIIIRTAAEGKQQEQIEKDIKDTIKKWNEIKQKAEKANKEAPILIQKQDTILEKILLDIIDNGLDGIWVNDNTLDKQIKSIIQKIDQSNRIKINIQEKELEKRYDLNTQIEKLSNRKIWLKCGGFITIDKTEALTAIDVNSGKFTGKKNLEDTVLKVNQEASIEIAKQLRLRDIGGIIVIDYIDMSEQESKLEIINILKENLKKDRAKTQIMEFTKLNLLEMTRKHMFGE